MLVPGMYLADRYEIIEKIGAGGMADVYKAKCHKLNRLVAVKVLKNEFSTDATFVKKFRVEAQSAAGLSHPNIVNVYDVGEESGIHYIVMELVQGITLKNYIDMKGKLEVREALNISIQIASGLSAAHQSRIIHRDVKPQNIIMSRDGKVKVTDFGIAKVADSTTVTTTAAGSVHYISPEQARGGYSDEKSDIYSLGITMYEMLTGKVPFDGETNVAVALLHIQGEMVPPRRLEPSIPRSFEKIILKCTQKKADRRYASAKELIADLRRVLSNPDGEYVLLAGAMADAVTTVMSEREIAAMRSGRANSGASYGAGSQYGSGAAAGAAGMAGSASGASRNAGAARNAGVSSRNAGASSRSDAELRRQEELRRQHAAEASRRQYEEDDDDSEVSPGLEKVMIGLGIVGAIVLVIAVCFIIGKAAGLFGGVKDSESDTDSMVSTESIEETEELEMISVTDLSKEEAEKKLKDAGIVAVFEEQASDKEEGTVVDQNPAAGVVITSDTKVTIYISSGKETFELGEFAGLELAQAKEKLSANKLEIGDILYEFSDEYDKDVVIRTNPAEGTEVSEGDEIVLVVSKGKESKDTTMPALIGKWESQVASILSSAGLKLGGTEYEYSEEVEAGKVIRFTVNGSSVSEGSKVTEGSSVVVYVSAGSQYAGQEVSETVTLSDSPFDAETGSLEVKMNGETVFSKSSCSSSDFPLSFTVKGEYGTSVVLDICVNGRSIGSHQVTFDGQ